MLHLLHEQLKEANVFGQLATAAGYLFAALIIQFRKIVINRMQQHWILITLIEFSMVIVPPYTLFVCFHG